MTIKEVKRKMDDLWVLYQQSNHQDDSYMQLWKALFILRNLDVITNKFWKEIVAHDDELSFKDALEVYVACDKELFNKE